MAQEAGAAYAAAPDARSKSDSLSAPLTGEVHLRAVFAALPDCVKIFDESGRLVHINPKGLELLQAPDLESLSRPGYIPVPPEYLEPCMDVHRRVIAGESVIWDYEVVGLEGRRRHVQAHAVPFRLPDGSPGHLCISRDITDRKESEETLRRSEERMRVVQESTGMAEFEAGPDGIISYSNRFYEQIGLPFRQKRMTFAEWLEFVHPEDRQKLRETVLRRANKADWSHTEFRIVRADTGEVRWLSAHFADQRDENGRLIRSIGAHIDITERKLAEEDLRASEERLRLVQEATGLADFEAAPGGAIRFSPRFAEQNGLPPDTTELTFEKWVQVIHPDDRQRVQRTVDESLLEGSDFHCEFRIIRPDNGDVRWISSRTRMDRDENNRVIRSVGAHLDITERKRAEEALRESEERFRLAAEAAGLGVWDYDMGRDRRQWSGRLREIFGFGEDIEPSLSAAIDRIHPEDRAKFEETLRHARAIDVARFQTSFRIIRANDAAERWVTMNGWRTFKTDTGLRRVIMTVRDVTDEKTVEERVRWSASHDSLTRLANRSLFQERLDNAIQRAEETGRTVGLLLLDLDHFKQINDTLGHDAGDVLLKMLADRLRTAVRPTDTVARLGGDEFAVVLPDLDGEHALMQVSRSIQEYLRAPFLHGGRILDCRVSVGASLFPLHCRTPQELLKNADVALYAAKAAGRGIVTMFEPRMRDDVQRRNAMVQLARNAIGQDRVIPYYQPKLDLAGRSICGFEALLRWRNPRGRIALPATLEAAFEDLDVAAQISDRMIERVIADMRGWLDRGIDFRNVAINASAAEFRRDNFAERLLEQLHRADISTQYFQLEVTETVFLGRGAEYVHRALGLLNKRGVKIALDDFGTGYASLRHLKQFPVDIIKIDQSFVRDMNHDPGDEAIVRAVINLGRSLGIKVVAEGIETEAQARHLRQLDCDFGQGFLFAKAVPAARVPALLERWPARPGPAETSPPDLRLVANQRTGR